MELFRKSELRRQKLKAGVTAFESWNKNEARILHVVAYDVCEGARARARSFFVL
jgi:hypothetical protein